MRHILAALVLAVSLAGLGAAPGLAAPLCGDRTEILENLEQVHSERPQSIGLSSDGGLIEVLVSDSGGWTILITYPKRPTCVVATGESWETMLRVAGDAV